MIAKGLTGRVVDLVIVEISFKLADARGACSLQFLDTAHKAWKVHIEYNFPPENRAVIVLLLLSLMRKLRP